MDKQIIIFVGSSKLTYLDDAKLIFPQNSHIFICITERDLSDKQKSNYLPHFDYVYDIDNFPAELEKSIKVVTCTQERDINTYIRFLKQIEFINSEQFNLWNKAVNKHLFKKKLSEILPEAIPKVSTYNPEEKPTSFPIVIKPVNFTGSSFVKIINNESELNIYLQILDETFKESGKMPDLILEEFVIGEQYSLNAYVDKVGHVVYCPIIRVIPAFEISQNDTYSALQFNTELPKEQSESLHNLISKVVKIFKISNTSVHFDCILSPTGWKLCEMGLRIGGLRQELFNGSHSFNHIKNDLLNRTGQKISLGDKAKTFAIVQKTTNVFCSLGKINYYNPASQNIETKIDKNLENEDNVGPVSLGGRTAFRMFLEGTDEELVVNEARKVFDQIDFEIIE